MYTTPFFMELSVFLLEQHNPFVVPGHQKLSEMSLGFEDKDSIQNTLSSAKSPNLTTITIKRV